MPAAVPALRLRPLSVADELQFVAAHEEMAAEGFTFGLGYEPGEPFDEYVRVLGNRASGIALPGRWQHWVRSAFLVAEVDGAIVGRIGVLGRSVAL